MVILILVLLGLCLGSFANAFIWRTHHAETGAKKAKTKQFSIWRGRSVCVHCHHELAAKDLVPLLSWLELRGRCRYCSKPISWQYPAVEVATAGLFVGSYLWWPWGFDLVGIVMFGLWLLITVLLVALLVYDLHWMELPNRLVYTLIGLSLALAAGKMAFLPTTDVIIGALAGILCLAGLFYLLFQLSEGSWIGGGDVKLAVALGLLVGGPLNAILLLFVASFTGSVVALPLLLSGKAGRKSQLPFGPFLIIATYVVFMFGDQLNHWYERIFLGL